MKILRWMRKHETLVSAIALTLACLAYFGTIESSSFVNDPDSFYHARMSRQVGEALVRLDLAGTQVPMESLPLTTLGDHFANHHFLYHVLASPFTLAFEPIIGIKVAQAIFATIAILTIFAVLKKLQARWALFWPILLLFSSGFIFRMTLPKVPALSVTVYALSLLMLFRKNFVGVAVLGWLYVWLYGGFPILLVTTIIVSASHVAYARFAKHPHNEPIWTSTDALRMIAAATLGIIVGVITHPYFPNNLSFYWEQIVRISLLEQASTIGIGREWSGISILEIVSNHALLLIPTTIISVLLAHGKSLTPRVISMIVLTTAFTVATVGSQRNGEYLTPTLVIMTALLATDSLRYPRTEFFSFWQKELLTRKYFYSAAALMLCICASFLMAKDVKWMLDVSRGGISITHLKASAEWLKANTSSSDIITHSDWDNFPELYYYHPQGSYIAGLDPRFFYFKNPELFQKWALLTQGLPTDSVANIMTQQLSSRTLVVEKDKTPLLQIAQQDPQLTIVYEDAEATIFQVTR